MEFHCFGQPSKMLGYFPYFEQKYLGYFFQFCTSKTPKNIILRKFLGYSSKLSSGTPLISRGYNIEQALIMSQGDTPLIRIKPNVLDEAEDANMKMLECLEGEPESSFIKIINNYSQPVVLKYVIEALMEEPEEDCLIRDENKGIVTIYLKTVIDCFNK